MLETIESVAGDRPETCPWLAFSDPFVLEILEAYAFFESGQLSLYWGADPANLLVEGIRHYHGAVRRVTADHQEKQLKEMKEARRGG